MENVFQERKEKCRQKVKITLTDINRLTDFNKLPSNAFESMFHAQNRRPRRAKNRSEERHHLINILHWNDNNRNPTPIREIQGPGKEQEPA